MVGIWIGSLVFLGESVLGMENVSDVAVVVKCFGRGGYDIVGDSGSLDIDQLDMVTGFLSGSDDSVRDYGIAIVKTNGQVCALVEYSYPLRVWVCMCRDVVRANDVVGETWKLVFHCLVWGFLVPSILYPDDYLAQPAHAGECLQYSGPVGSPIVPDVVPPLRPFLVVPVPV